jgi:hypothetical protein
MSDRQVGLRDGPFNRQENQHNESCERDAGGALSHINFKCITFAGLPHVADCQACVGAAGDGNTVFTFPIDENQRHARGTSRVSRNMGYVDPVVTECSDSPITERVPADPSDEADSATGACRCYSLIGALAPAAV